MAYWDRVRVQNGLYFEIFMFQLFKLTRYYSRSLDIQDGTTLTFDICLN